MPEFSIPESRQVAKTREHLAKVFAVIELNKHRRFKDSATIMVIPTTNKDYIDIYGSSQNVSNGIKFMKEIGLITTYDDSYQFRAYYDEDNRAKQYVWYKENEDKIIEYCLLNGIDRYSKSNNNTIVQNFILPDFFDISAVRIGSNLNLLKPENWSGDFFEEQVTKALFVNYPYLEHYFDLKDYINETYYKEYPELEVKLRFHIEWNKKRNKIVSIGTRATNKYVSAKKDDSNKVASKLYRDEVMKEFGLHLKYDVKSSIHRITLSMNEGYWIDESIDIYELIFIRYISRRKYYIESINNTIVQNFKLPEFTHE